MVSALELVGGLALFLWGMGQLAECLRRLARGRLSRLAGELSARPLRGVLPGFVLTALLQSSSAMTVLLTGLAEAGILRSRDTLGLLVGTNLGAAVSPWLWALAGEERGLSAEQLALLCSFGGMVLYGGGRRRTRDAGRVLLSLAVLLFGMEHLRRGLLPLAAGPAFSRFLAGTDSPLLLVLLGTAFTAVIQSSAASAGLLQTLTLSGAVTVRAAAAVAAGQNLGTCATAHLAALGRGREARRVALYHTLFNAAGLLLSLPALLHPSLLPNRAATPLTVAALHTLFNALTAAVLCALWELLGGLGIIRPGSGHPEGVSSTLRPGPGSGGEPGRLRPSNLRGGEGGAP